MIAYRDCLSFGANVFIQFEYVPKTERKRNGGFKTKFLHKKKNSFYAKKQRKLTETFSRPVEILNTQ